MNDIWHVYPENDYRDHDLSPDCWCSPTPSEDMPNIYMHHSMDRREEFEEGRRKPS